jgi:hypothetical protein
MLYGTLEHGTLQSLFHNFLSNISARHHSDEWSHVQQPSTQPNPSEHWRMKMLYHKNLSDRGCQMQFTLKKHTESKQEKLPACLFPPHARDWMRELNCFLLCVWVKKHLIRANLFLPRAWARSEQALHVHQIVSFQSFSVACFHYYT